MSDSLIRAYGLRWLLVPFLCLVLRPVADAQSTMPLPQAQVGQPYSEQLKAQGGLAPLVWTAEKGALPQWLQLSRDGMLHGTPKQASATAVTFTVQVSDSSKPAFVAKMQFSILVKPAPLRIAGYAHAPLKSVGAAAPSSPANVQKTTPEGSDGKGKADNAGGSQLSSGGPSGQPGQHGSNGAPTATAALGTYSLYTLGMAGLDVTSTSTSGPEQQAFVEYDLTAPVRFGWLKKAPAPIESSWWVWFDPRIASVPTPKTATLSSLASASSGLTATGVQRLGDITQTLEFRGGLEYAFLKPSHGILFGHKPVADISMSFIAGFGVVTPFNSAAGSQEFDLGQPSSSGSGYNVTNVLGQLSGSPQLQGEYSQLYSALNTKCSTSPTTCPLEHVAFVLPNRSRFYRSYFGGFRLKTFFFKDSNGNKVCTQVDSCAPADIFPGTFDFTVGQDETVTGGKLRGIVGTISVNYPITRWPWLRVFGAAYLRFAGNQNSQALALPATQSFVSIEDPSVVLQQIQPRDKDYFRLGFGIDLVQLVKAMAKRWSSQPATLSEASLDFPQGASSNPRTLTLTNSGSATLTGISIITSPPANFAAHGSDTNCGTSLAAGDKCTIAVTFTPPSNWSSGQPQTGSLIIKTDASQLASVVPLSAEKPKKK